MEFLDFATIVQRVVTFMPAFLFALVVHEYAHAWMAQRFGDNTAEWSGRLTLNPLAHIDPIGTVALPLLFTIIPGSFFFGWAKPVPIDSRRFSNHRKGLFWVSFAGPLSNVLFGFLSAFVLVAISLWLPKDFGYGEAMRAMLESFILINFSLAVFNMIPIPPLDGSNILLSFLSYSAARKYMELQQFSFFFILFLMMTGVTRYLAIPVLFLANGSLTLAATVLTVLGA